MELGKKIKQLRIKAGLTQEQLAEQIGVGAQAVSKWENAVSMPDITSLPLLAEVFGVSIDDLFDLTVEQRMNRIEHRMDMEDRLTQDVFLEYESFLKALTAEQAHKKRATELLAYLYWHRMEMYGKQARAYAKEAVQAAPGEKNCQWILQKKPEGHAAWDWNMANHTRAIDFYRELTEQNPELCRPYYYLLDNLIADHRADEAEQSLERLSRLKDANPILVEAYRAHIALARFDEKTADGIVEALLQTQENNALFEAAQYYAKKCSYEKALELYEKSFQQETRRPRFTDALMAIADIYLIQRNWKKAAETYGRIIDLLENEWGDVESDELKRLYDKRAELLAKA